MNTFILKSVILEDGIPVFFTFKSCVQHRLIKILMYTRRIKFSWGKTFPLCTFAIIPFGGPMLQSLTGSIHCFSEIRCNIREYLSSWVSNGAPENAVIALALHLMLCCSTLRRAFSFSFSRAAM